MRKLEKAYKEILSLMDKHKSDIVFDVDYLKEKAKNHLFGSELVELYGFDLNPKSINDTNWQSLGNNMSIGLWDGVKRSISWSDNGEQPNNETLLLISFPTGAYIFGEDYPQDIFNEFFAELKSYNPKYIDTANKSLYFDLKNGGKIYNRYNFIIKKYYDKNKEDFKLRQIKKLELELSKLKS